MVHRFLRICNNQENDILRLFHVLLSGEDPYSVFSEIEADRIVFQPLPNVEGVRYATIKYLWQHVKDRRIHGLVKEVSENERDEAVDSAVPTPIDEAEYAVNGEKIMEPVALKSSESVAPNTRKVSLTKASEVLYGEVRTGCGCRSRLPCFSAKCSCKSSGIKCGQSCRCKEDCFNKGSFLRSICMPKQIRKAGEDTSTKSSVTGLVQWMNNCYAGSTLTSLRVQPWWCDLIKKYPEVAILEKVKKLWNANSRFSCDINNSRYRSEFEEAFKSFIVSLNSGQFKPGDQEDPAEFLHYLMQQVMEKLNGVSSEVAATLRDLLVVVDETGIESFIAQLPIYHIDNKEVHIYADVQRAVDHHVQTFCETGEYLVIHLVGCGDHDDGFKVNKMITLPSGITYTANAVICYNCRHFVSYVLQGFTWIRYDGSSSKVAEFPEKHGPYMVFYQRTKSVLTPTDDHLYAVTCDIPAEDTK